MKRMFVIIPTLIVLLGISDVAFAKHHHHSKKEDNQDNKDNKDNKGRKVPCLVQGVQQMVKSEDVCKDFNGTVVTDKTPQGVTAVSKEKITEQKIQSK
jgi:hypothetical protein